MRFRGILLDIPYFMQPALNVVINNWQSSSSLEKVILQSSFWYIKDYGYHETNVTFLNYGSFEGKLLLYI